METKEQVTEADLQIAINQATLEFLQENRDEIIRRAHNLLRAKRKEKKEA